jgi:hypothetical protein
VIGTVTATYRNQDQQFADITVLGTDHKLHQLETTQHHRFWDVTRNAWVFALDLAPGDQLQAADGSPVTIESISTYQGSEVMYDLTVDSVHDFFVVVSGVSLLVHNCGDTALARDLGTKGETQAGIDASAKVRIPSASGTAAYRIPDALSETTLTEVKNVTNLRATNQIRDFMYHAVQNNLRFDLIVRSDTELSSGLTNLVNIMGSPINVIRSL